MNNELEKVLAHFENLDPMKPQGALTGFKVLDEKLKGLRRIVVLAGEPKTNKTTISLQWTLKMLEDNYIVTYIDSENGLLLTYRRLICNIAKIPSENFFPKSFNETEKDNYTEGCNKLRKLCENFHYIHEPKHINKDYIETHINALRQQHSSNKLVFIVDSLQKLPELFEGNGYSSINSWLRFFEIYSKDEITFILISEVSRRHYENKRQNKNKRFPLPKESGDIEYTLNTLINIERVNKRDAEPYINLDISYCRDGETGSGGTYQTSNPFCWKLEPYQTKLKYYELEK